MAYILRYSVAKVYAAKFKLQTVAAVFKVGGNNLAQAIGNTRKSAIGATESDTPRKGQKITGILYDKYYKTPKPQASKLKADWEPEHFDIIRNAKDPQDLLSTI